MKAHHIREAEPRKENVWRSRLMFPAVQFAILAFSAYWLFSRPISLPALFGYRGLRISTLNLTEAQGTSTLERVSFTCDGTDVRSGLCAVADPTEWSSFPSSCKYGVKAIAEGDTFRALEVSSRNQTRTSFLPRELFPLYAPNASFQFSQPSSKGSLLALSSLLDGSEINCN